MRPGRSILFRLLARVRDDADRQDRVAPTPDGGVGRGPGRAARSGLDQRHLRPGLALQGDRHRVRRRVQARSHGHQVPAGGRDRRSGAYRSERVRPPHRRRHQDAPAVQADAGRRGHRGDGAHRGRDRHRQGAHRRGDPQPLDPARRAVHRVRLRLGAARAHRERAFRPREGLVHRRHHRSQGRLRRRPRRHHLPRRDRRDGARPPALAPARARQEGGPAGRLEPVREDRRPGGGGDQPRSARRGGQEELPRGPLLPARGHPALGAAAPGARDRHPAPHRVVHQQVLAGAPLKASPRT